MSSEQLAEKALEEGAEHILLVERGQSGSGSIRFCNIGQSGLFSIPPVIHVCSIKLRRDFEILSKVKPVRGIAILGPVPSDEVRRFAEMLVEFFGISLLSTDEEAGKTGNLIVLDHDRMGRLIVTFTVEPGHVEVGPRVTVSKMEWMLGA